MYKYRRFEKGVDRHFFNTKPRQIKYIVGNKFILEGDEVNPNNEPDEQEVNEKGETEIRWKGLTDKNSDKLYASKTTLTSE